MKCLQPIFIPFEHPFLHGYSLRVPCGKCKWCLEKRQKEWAFRLHQEAKYSKSFFVTCLTYDTDNLPLLDGVPVLSKKDLQLFIKRVRADIMKTFKCHVRFFAVGEYGGKYNRPHYHVFFFFDDIISYDDFVIMCLRNWQKCDRYVLMRGCEIPGKGMMYYVAQYCLKSYGMSYDFLPKKFQPFMTCSLRPAIGSAYLTEAMIYYHRQGKILYGTLEDGVKVALPRFYKNKIWNDQERRSMFSRLLLEEGNIPDTHLQKFLDEYEDVEIAHRNFVSSYNDDFNSAKRLYRNKRKL